jgi:outer membrane protein OmpA-like peptidoglycan-associated protein
MRGAILAGALAVAVVATGCANTRPHPEIQRVKREYQMALEDPLVDRKDSIQLLEAEKDIKAAEAANRDKDFEAVTHHTYVADTRIRIARLTAETKAANRKAAELARQRPELRLEARTAEADVATARARQAEQEARMAQDKARKLESQLDEMEARQSERGHVLTLGGVSFDFNDSELKPEATRKLSLLAGFLIANPDRNVLVEAYGDAVGTAEANELVSRARAQSVRRYLVANGVASERIATEAHGKEDPLASNQGVEGRAMNRRAQITILPPGVAAY